jgi:uncharacterized protein VirK/YbjX
LNKPNHPPAGVLGVGIDAFLPPGASAPERYRRFAPASPTFLAKCGAVVAKFSATFIEATRGGTPVNMLRSLRGRRDWRGAWYKRGVSALKYLLRSGCMPVQHGSFLDFVYASPRMMAYRQRDPRLLERHMHRYINANWKRSQRLESLHQHYRFVLAHLPNGLFDLVYALGHASLGSMKAKDGSLLTLCMRPPIFMGCEGELCLQLCDVNEDPLYSIVFSIVGERPRIVIGCLQGPRGDNAKDVVRALTRNLYGMRPKHLMLSLVYTFARHFGITEISAISNDAHPLRRTGRPVLADYDAFWEEQQGMAAGGGWYILPSSQSHKSEADVPSNHRSAFRRREALRRETEQLLANALTRRVVGQVAPLVQERQAAYKRLQNFSETSWAS